MRVDGHGDLDVAVARDLADDVGRHPEGEQQRDGRVAQVVEAQRRDARPVPDVVPASDLAQVLRRRVASSGARKRRPLATTAIAREPALTATATSASACACACACASTTANSTEY